MNHLKIWTIAATVIALLGFGVSSLAGANGDGRHGRYNEKIIKELNLDEQQQALLNSSRDQMREQFTQMQALRQQLKQIVQSDNYDSAAVDKLADEMATSTRSQVLEHAGKMHAFYQSLNQEQRAQLAELEQQRAERRQRYMKQD